MKPLLNTLYVTLPEAYLALEGESLVVKNEEKTILQLPLHNLENIVAFNYLGASPALMSACSNNGIGMCFLTPFGSFQARIQGKIKGNVLLRKHQYIISEIEEESVPIASSFLIGKIANCKKVIDRAVRDHALLVNVNELKETSSELKAILLSIKNATTVAELMAFEGSAAKMYFKVFDQLILHQKESFQFTHRTRRPPLDNMNALLSFFYSILTNEVASALETVGLDPYVGFLHQDRPGRPALALDLMEELRPVFADRLALSLVNLRQINGDGFTQKESGGVLMTDETRKKVLSAWQERKKEIIIHPFLKEKIPFGLVPYVQALLLSRYLRGDLDAYPPFFWN